MCDDVCPFVRSFVRLCFLLIQTAYRCDECVCVSVAWHHDNDGNDTIVLCAFVCVCFAIRLRMLSKVNQQTKNVNYQHAIYGWLFHSHFLTKSYLSMDDNNKRTNTRIQQKHQCLLHCLFDYVRFGSNVSISGAIALKFIPHNRTVFNVISIRENE